MNGVIESDGEIPDNRCNLFVSTNLFEDVNSNQNSLVELYSVQSNDFVDIELLYYII